MDCNEMTCFRLYKWAYLTREAQIVYFRTRAVADLRTVKALERELDNAIADYRRIVLGQHPDHPDSPNQEVTK